MSTGLATVFLAQLDLSKADYDKYLAASTVKSQSRRFPDEVTGTLEAPPTPDHPFYVPRGALLYPVCSSGKNLSQVMFVLLNNITGGKGSDVTAFPRVAGMRALVTRPHGVNQGYDPPQREWKNWSHENFAADILHANTFTGMFSESPSSEPFDDTLDQYVSPRPDLVNAAFVRAFSVTKQRRVAGQAYVDRLYATGGTEPSISDRKHIYNNRKMTNLWFDQNYYGRGHIPYGRGEGGGGEHPHRIYFCVYAACGPLVRRITSSGHAYNTTVVPLDMNDPWSAGNALAPDKMQLQWEQMYTWLADRIQSADAKPTPNPNPDTKSPSGARLVFGS